jgi:CubicO group peptidase (beta-lactamase class C family)
MCTCASSSRFQKANLRPALHSTSATGRRSIGLSLPVRRTHAIAIVHDGRVVAERYADGFDIDTPVHGWSATKSVNNGLPGSSYAKGSSRWDDPAPWPPPAPPAGGRIRAGGGGSAGRHGIPTSRSDWAHSDLRCRLRAAGTWSPRRRCWPSGARGTHKEDVSPGEMQKRVRKMFWPRQW